VCLYTSQSVHRVRNHDAATSLQTQRGAKEYSHSSKTAGAVCKYVIALVLPYILLSTAQPFTSPANQCFDHLNHALTWHDLHLGSPSLN